MKIESIHTISFYTSELCNILDSLYENIKVQYEYELKNGDYVNLDDMPKPYDFIKNLLTYKIYCQIIDETWVNKDVDEILINQLNEIYKKYYSEK